MKKHIAVGIIALTSIKLTVCAVDAAEKNVSSLSARSSKPIEVITNSIGMKFVKVPAGSFVMGSNIARDKCPPDDPLTTCNENEECKRKARSHAPPENETPAHRITISNDFWIGQYEVTQEEWYKVMGKNPAQFKTENVGEDSSSFPVENVSWYDVQQFISRLNAKEGKQYRLPSEAEWEYACKNGDSNEHLYEQFCGGKDVDAVAWYGYETSGKRTHRVGTKKPNRLGIYDMSGNVWEWVNDLYGENYYNNSRGATDPQGSSSGSYRVNRGGSWDNQPHHLRASIRFAGTPDARSDRLGFRLVSPGR